MVAVIGALWALSVYAIEVRRELGREVDVLTGEAGLHQVREGMNQYELQEKSVARPVEKDGSSVSIVCVPPGHSRLRRILTISLGFDYINHSSSLVAATVGIVRSSDVFVEIEEGEIAPPRSDILDVVAEVLNRYESANNIDGHYVSSASSRHKPEVSKERVELRRCHDHTAPCQQSAFRWFKCKQEKNRNCALTVR